MERATERLSFDFGLVILFFLRVVIGCWFSGKGLSAGRCGGGNGGLVLSG